MRLLNTFTLQFEEFQSTSSLPYYAILSHRWTNAESSYKQFRKALDPTHSGCKKVLDFCSFAQVKGMEFVWVDTCCIDKRSSAELSEAINSIVCYVHMADVGPRSPEAAELQVADIRKSAWFSRGWTLQELLAPYRVEFCTNDWQVIGTKTDEPFLQLLHEITQIPLPALRDPRLVTEYSVAQRMSWAASRRTTRTEDQAYCLLGLFQVNMALLYGEGARAFHRLQREILAQNDDESIFAWTVDRYMVATSLGVLADSPRDFAGSGEIVRTHRTLQPPSVTTNKGLSFTPRTAFHHDHLSEEVWIVYLECGTLKERKKVKDAGLTGSFHRRDVHQSTIALTREQQAQLLTQEEWREGMAASKRLGGSDAALIVGMRTKHQPSFYRVYANSLSRQDMTESLPRGKGRLALNRSFYLRV